MLDIPLYGSDGKPAGKVQIDAEALGGRVKSRLLKQALVAYHANRRQNTSATRGRSAVEGSTRKLYRQKGTGNARVGNRRTNIRRGGGVAFAKGGQDYSQSLNKKMRRLARDNAILAKVLSSDAMVVEAPSYEEPSTKRFASLMRAIGVERQGCLFAMGEASDTMYRSGRNVVKLDIKPLNEVHAGDILRRRKLVLTKSAFEALSQHAMERRASKQAAAVQAE